MRFSAVRAQRGLRAARECSPRSLVRRLRFHSQAQAHPAHPDHVRDVVAVTSGRRYADRPMQTLAVWTVLQLLYSLGVSADSLPARSYAVIRTRPSEVKLTGPPRHWGSPITIGALAVLLVSERLWPLRPRVTEPGRFVTNALMGLLASATSLVLEAPLTAVATRAVERRRWGLPTHREPCRAVPPGVLWLDWTLYLWHRATHLQPQLWRLHLPLHHLYPTLDTTTAWRFHALESMASVPVRLLQISVVGVPAGALQLWRQLLLLSISFTIRAAAPPGLGRSHARAARDDPAPARCPPLRAQRRAQLELVERAHALDHLHGTFRSEGDASSVPIGVEGELPGGRLRAYLAPTVAGNAKPGSPGPRDLRRAGLCLEAPRRRDSSSL